MRRVREILRHRFEQGLGHKSIAVRVGSAPSTGEDRYGRRSTIITSQLPESAWHGAIGDPIYADAILDRLVHNAHRVELSGDSLRRNLPRKA
jgi:hypothetical protein